MLDEPNREESLKTAKLMIVNLQEYVERLESGESILSILGYDPTYGPEQKVPHKCYIFNPIPLQPKRGLWTQPSHLPVEAIRLRHKDATRATYLYGTVITATDRDGITVVNSLGDFVFIAWSTLNDQLWLSGKDWEWRRCEILP
jgi:hypothetical protein